ncbi:phage integrase N-terminal SAM-like domain-containing protein, partial [Vibrio sp. 1978]
MKSQFLISVKEHMLTRHYANKTIESYLFWIKRFIVFHQLAHPSKLSEDDVIRFLSHLAIDEKVAVKTQALALNAISFLYRDFFKTPLSLDMRFQKSLTEKKLPVVLTRDEVRRFVQHIDP